MRILCCRCHRATEAPENPLTERQREVLQMLAHGDVFKTVAAKRSRTHESVTKLVKAARRKLGAKNAAHAIALAMRRGEIE